MLLTVGRIIRPHGIHGEVIVDVRTDEPEARFAAGSVLVTGPAANGSGRGTPGTMTVEATRWHQGRLIVTFRGVGDRDAAERLRGVALEVDSAGIPAPADPDEFHDHQLIGLTVVDTAGEPLGEVIRIEHAPASDLLVISRPEGRTALIPFVSAIVPRVDLAVGRVVADPPPGLLDL